MVAVRSKIFTENEASFYAFVKTLLSGGDPDEIEVPDCGLWRDWAAAFHHQYDQSYAAFSEDQAVERTRRYILAEMKKDSDMAEIIGAALHSESLSDNNGLNPLNITEEDLDEEDGFKHLLKRFDFPKLQKMTWQYKNGKTISVDPCLPEELGKQARGFIDDFMKWAGDYAKWSHPLMLESTAIWILSMVAARRIYLDIEHGGHTIFNFIICADSTEYAKSSAALMGIRLLEHTNLHWLLVNDSMTPPMFMMQAMPDVPANYDMLNSDDAAVEDFKQKFKGKYSIFFDEMGDMFTSMLQPNGTYAPYLKWILKLDNSPRELAYDTVKNSKRRIKDPYLTILGCMTMDDFRKVPKGSANPFQRGLMPRTVIITPPRLWEPNLDVTNLKKPQVPTDLMKRLRRFHEMLEEPDLEYVKKGDDSEAIITNFPEKEAIITDEVFAAHTRYVQALKLMLYDEKTSAMIPGELRPSYIRFPTKAIRLAALLAWESNGGVITLEEWAAAQAITESWRESAHEFYNQMNNGPAEITEGRKNEDRLLQHLKNKGCWAKAYELAPFMGLDTKKTTEMLDSLCIAQTLVCRELEGKNGRPSKVYCVPDAPVPERFMKYVQKG